MKFKIVNVFTSGGLYGNQLAVVFPTHQLSTETMQSIAQEFNFSETVFIFNASSDVPSLRIFTPKSELPFAGHPTVGAGYILSQLTGKKSFQVQVPLGRVLLSSDSDKAVLTFPGQAKIRFFDDDVKNVLEHCGVKTEDVDTELIRLVHVGPEFLVIPLRTEESMINAYSPLTLGLPLKIYFTYQLASTHFKVRMFSPSLSVIEDAATGSAACALGAYLKEVKGMSTGSFTISQGKEMNRPSEIYLDWDDSIRVGGSVKLWAEGELSL